MNLEIGRVDTERLLEEKLREKRHAWKPEDWDVFWALVRETSQRAVLQVLQDARVDPLSLRVRNLKGDYSPLGLLLLPGEIAQEGSVDDAKAVIDTHFHGDELATLRLLGATSGPSRNGGSRVGTVVRRVSARGGGRVPRRTEQERRGAEPGVLGFP